jgi:hypothetical protein
MKRPIPANVVDLLLDEDWSFNDASFFQQFLESCFPGKEDEIRVALVNDEDHLRLDLKKAFCTDWIEVDLQHAVLKRFVLLINNKVDTQKELVVLALVPFEEPVWLRNAKDKRHDWHVCCVR